MTGFLKNVFLHIDPKLNSSSKYILRLMKNLKSHINFNSVNIFGFKEKMLACKPNHMTKMYLKYCRCNLTFLSVHKLASTTAATVPQKN